MARMMRTHNTLLTKVGFAAFGLAWLAAAFEAVRYTPKAY